MRIMPQSCLAKLSPRDFEFMGLILNQIESSLEDPFLRLARDPDTLHHLLKHPKLLAAITSLKQPINISAELYFFVIVRHALCEAGIDHLEMTDYVAGTLVEFAKGNPFRTETDDQLQVESTPYHVDFIEAINSANAYDRFYLHVRCGNQFLVLTGLFPGFIKNREKRRGAPGVRYYEGVARESYRSAREHPLANEFNLCEVYDMLTDQFRQTRRALNHLAMEYLWIGG